MPGSTQHIGMTIIRIGISLSMRAGRVGRGLQSNARVAEIQENRRSKRRRDDGLLILYRL